MRRRRSTCSINSDSSEMDIDLLAETELTKLQRQFRIMERDRQAYGIESQDLIRRQKQEIQRLQDEQEELLRSLQVSESLFCRWNDSQATHSLSAMLVYRDRVEEQLNSEQTKLTILKEEILKWGKKLAGQRRGGRTTCLSQKSEAHQTQNNCLIMENKLDRGCVRFNKLLAKNGQLREELKILHVERKQFLSLYSRMDKELQLIRKDSKDKIVQSTAAFEDRVEAQCKRRMLKEKMMRDLAQYGIERSELERAIAHDHHLKTFLGTKGNEHIIQDEGHEQGEEKQRKLDCKEWGFDDFEEAIHKIHVVTGDKDLDELVKAFIKMEQNNFALLKFVNEQNNEVEAIKEQIRNIQRVVESCATEEHMQHEEYISTLGRVSTQQQVTEGQGVAYQQRITLLDKILDQLKSGVNSVLLNINCDRSKIKDKLGSSTGVGDSTIMVYMGLVEQKTNDLLTLQLFLSSKDLNRNYNPKIAAQHLLGQSPPVSRNKTIFEIPTVGDSNDPEESLLMEQMKPLSRDLLLPLVNKRMLRKARIVMMTTSQRSSLQPNLSPLGSRTLVKTAPAK